MEYHSAGRGAAHPGVIYAHHVSDAFAAQAARCPTSGMQGPHPPGPFRGVRARCPRPLRHGIVHAGMQVVNSVKHHGAPAVTVQHRVAWSRASPPPGSFGDVKPRSLGQPGSAAARIGFQRRPGCHIPSEQHEPTAAATRERLARRNPAHAAQQPTTGSGAHGPGPFSSASVSRGTSQDHEAQGWQLRAPLAPTEPLLSLRKCG